MPSPHDQIADHARDAWDRAHALLLAARTAGADRVDIDLLADYAHEQRVAWLQACDRARRADDRQPDPYQVLAALDYGATDQESVR